MPNIELLKRVRAQITEHPETHNQRVWAKRTECGTTACVAGWAVLLAHPDAELTALDCFNGMSCGVLLSDGTERAFNMYGAELLGLTPDQRYWLFDEERTTPEVLGGLDDLINGEPTGYMNEYYDPEDYDWGGYDEAESGEDPDIAADADPDWGVPSIELQAIG
jgi:hypothetical protein